MAPTAWHHYRRLLRYALPYWRLFLASTLATTAYAGTDTLFAALLKPMLDEGFVRRDPQAIRLVPLLLILLFIFRGLTGFAANYGMNWIGRRVIQSLRDELFAHLLRLPSRYYERSTSGELVTRLIYHVEQVSQATTNAVTVLVRDSFTVIFLIAWMFYISGWLALVFLVLAPVVAILIRLISRRLRRVSSRIQNSMTDVTNVAEEAVEGQRIIKAFGAQAHELARFRDINNKNRGLQMKLTVASAASVPIVQLLAAATLALVVYLATTRTASGMISPGAFVSFIGAMLLLMPPIKRLTSVNASLQRGIAAAESIFGLLDLPLEQDQGTERIERAKGWVRYRDVCFAYDADEAPVLQEVSFVVEPGQMLALVGRSGSGKTTLVSLLPRFYDPTAGAIELDGRDLREYRLADLRRQIAWVGQDVVLFNDTVAANIAYGSGGTARREDIERAAAAAHALDFIRALPQGFDTLLGQQGTRLSGGQRQRIAIARAILRDAPILILDEATSALDTESERAVQQGLESLMQARTTLVIAHRLSTVERADRILVLDAGRILEQGTHAELLHRDGAYAALYRMQFHQPRESAASAGSDA